MLSEGPREWICNDIGLSRLVSKSEVIFSKIEGLAGLSASEVLGGSPILEVVVVHPDVKEF